MSSPEPTHTFYLTQRWKTKENKNKTGFSNFLSADNMGAAEFEWGAVPCALRLTRKLHQSAGYKIHELRHPRFQTSFWIALLPNHDKAAVEKDIFAIITEAKDAPNVKEYLHINAALKAKESGGKSESWVQDTWCTVPRYNGGSRHDPEFYPVWMSLYKETLDKVLAEALLPDPK